MLWQQVGPKAGSEDLRHPDIHDSLRPLASSPTGPTMPDSLLPHRIADIFVAIVTFSPQTPMIKEVLKQRFPDIFDRVRDSSTRGQQWACVSAVASRPASPRNLVVLSHDFV